MDATLLLRMRELRYMTADLVSRLRVHADRDNCVSHDWGGDYHDAGEDCMQAADEIERLRFEALRCAWMSGWRAAKADARRKAKRS